VWVRSVSVLSRCVSLLALCAAVALAGTQVLADDQLAPLRERAAFGAYTKGLPYFPEGLRRMEAPGYLGRVDIVSGFVDWEYVLGEERDVYLSGRGARKLLYSWEPHCEGPGGCIRFRDVSAGKLDAYFARVVESMRAFPHDIYVRPWAEMNANWSPYRPGSDQPLAGSVDEFKAAWRYLVTFFRSRGVHNLRFVFCPDAAVDDSDHVPIAQIWPGQEYVDVLGIDGYNWGESGRPGGNTWQEFEAVFAPMYATLTGLHQTAPVWICEFGTKEPKKSDGSKGSPAPRDPKHSKARWIQGFMSSRAFPRMEALVYYDAYTPERDNQRDFRFTSSPEALQMMRKQLALARKQRERNKSAAQPSLNGPPRWSAR
jgi:hypothetical protein